MANEELLEVINELESDTGVKQGFFINLLYEDDWSFVIKLHALYEASVSNLIINKIGEPALEEFVYKLDLGDKGKGKLKLSKSLGLLDEDERKFIYALSEIRNNFVHNVNNTQISLNQYFSRLSKDKRKHYINTFGYAYPGPINIVGETIEPKVFTEENPKIAIWHNSMYVLSVISRLSSTERTLNIIKNTKIELFERTEANNAPQSTPKNGVTEL